ncbi:hypothetical protein EDD11_000230, partial [Mortierella claussenii]
MSGFTPFNARMNYMFHATCTRLAMAMVKNAIRAHYYGAEFEEDMKRPENTNAITFFFEQNNVKHMFRDFCRARLAPTFIYLSEEDLVHILSTDPTTRGILLRVLSCSSDNQARKYVVDNKGVLIDRLFYNTTRVGLTRRDGYQDKVSLQSVKAVGAKEKYKIKGTICTNGLVLHLMAYDTTQARPKRKPAKDNAPADDDDEMADLFGMEDNAFELDVAFLDDQSTDDDSDLENPGSEIEVYDEPGPSSSSRKRRRAVREPEDVEMEPSDVEMEPTEPSGPSTMEIDTQENDYDVSQINWKRGSKMLQNLEVTFADPQQSPPFDSTVVVGVDPGEVNTVTATKIDPARAHERHSVT